MAFMMALIIASLTARAGAAPERQLMLAELPAPRPQTLRMRIALTPAQAVTPAWTATDTGRFELLGSPRRGLGEDSLAERVIFRFNLGFGLDGGQPTGVDARKVSGLPLREGEYDRLRLYSFGDAILGSRGLAVPSLSTYAAAQFRFDQASDARSTPVPSVYDANISDVQVRSAYAELDGTLRAPWLAPLFVRAGRQFRFGPAIAHFDGITVGWDGQAVAVGAYVGQHVILYDYEGGAAQYDRDVLAGADVRVDLYQLRGWPLVLGSRLLQQGEHTHSDWNLALRWSRDILLGGDVRFIDTRSAQQRVSMRARLGEVTILSAEVDNHTSADWIYDLLLIERPTDATDPRRYLDLGPRLPRVFMNLRAGTVLLDNIDLLVRAGAAFETASSTAPTSSFASDYLEAGGALELRLRRSLSFGVSALARRYDRIEPELPVQSDRADPLPLSTGSFGERSFFEGGSTLRYTQGARRFSASAELYGRSSRYQSPWIASQDERSDVRGGGRFAVEGWAGDSLRLRVEYDVSSQLRLAQELRGLKSLRVMTEGRF